MTSGTEPPRRRRRAWALGFVVLAFVAGFLDAMRPPERQLMTAAALRGIEIYQATLSPHMDKIGATCRFEPTCSHYGHAVIARDGALRGGLRAAGRVLRCGPWTPPGTVDPP